MWSKHCFISKPRAAPVGTHIWSDEIQGAISSKFSILIVSHVKIFIICDFYSLPESLHSFGTRDGCKQHGRLHYVQEDRFGEFSAFPPQCMVLIENWMGSTSMVCSFLTEKIQCSNKWNISAGSIAILVRNDVLGVKYGVNGSSSSGLWFPPYLRSRNPSYLVSKVDLHQVFVCLDEIFGCRGSRNRDLWCVTAEFILS